jgi:hypothetical protein
MRSVKERLPEKGSTARRTTTATTPDKGRRALDRRARRGGVLRQARVLVKMSGVCLQGNVIYFSKARISQNIEEFLTTKAHQGAEGRNKALFHASFVRLIRLCG